MRDANPITDLLFTIDDVEYAVGRVFLTPFNQLYVELKNPKTKCSINFPLGSIESFADKTSVRIDVKPNSAASRELIHMSVLKNLNLSSDS